MCIKEDRRGEKWQTSREFAVEQLPNWKVVDWKKDNFLG